MTVRACLCVFWFAFINYMDITFNVLLIMYVKDIPPSW